MQIDKIKNGFLVLAANYGASCNGEYAPTIDAAVEKAIWILTGRRGVVEIHYAREEQEVSK